jgi:phosphate transport system permease protein
MTVRAKPSLQRFLSRPGIGDDVAKTITLVFVTFTLLITGALAVHLYSGSVLIREKFGWRFLFGSTWDPIAEQFGALPFIYGTLITSTIALLIAVPVGVGAAIFLAELAPPRLSGALLFVIELLAAVPSVIYGLLGIFVLVPLLRDPVQPFLIRVLGFLPIFRGPNYGVGFLAAGLLLAIMIVPFIISIAREALLAVPPEQKEAALAVGATRWEATWDAVVPYARLGISGGVFLALARALGETMAVTMVIGNDPRISASLMAPGYTVAAVIANEFTEAVVATHSQALVALGLVLFLLTMLINGLGRVFLRFTAHGGITRQ